MSLITYYGTELLLVKQHNKGIKCIPFNQPYTAKSISYSSFKQPTEIIRGFYNTWSGKGFALDKKSPQNQTKQILLLLQFFF